MVYCRRLSRLNFVLRKVELLNGVLQKVKQVEWCII